MGPRRAAVAEGVVFKAAVLALQVRSISRLSEVRTPMLASSTIALYRSCPGTRFGTSDH